MMFAIDILKRRPIAVGGAGADPVVTLQPGSYSTTVVDPDDAQCALNFLGDGSMVAGDDNGVGYAWRVGGSSLGLQIQFVPSAGTLSSANANAWLDLAPGVTFRVTRLIVGNKYCAGAISIRRASDGVVLAGPVNVDLTAIVEAGDGGPGGPGGGGGGGGDYIP